MEKETNNPETVSNTTSKEGTKKTGIIRKIGDKFLLYLAENPNCVIPLVSIVFGGFNLLMSSANKRNNNCWVVDNITKEKFLTKHPLTNGEILELGERMNDGELKGEALSNMGLLKEEKRRK